MNEIKQVEKLAVCIEVVSRIATFSLAQSYTEKQIKEIFNSMEECMSKSFTSKEAKGIIEDYKRDCLMIKRALDKEDEYGV